MMTEKNDRTEETRTRHALIEVLTENGFSIVRSRHECESAQGGAGVYGFIVSHPEGLKRAVFVEFSTAAVAAIQRKRRIPLSRESSFWIACAERSLAMYLSERNHPPPGGKLILDEMCLAELEIARRWDCETPPHVELRPQNRLRASTLGKSFYVQSIIAVLFLYFIAAFTPKIIAAGLTSLRAALSNLILYAAIFLSGTLAGLAVNDLAPVSALFKMAATSESKIPEQSVMPYDEQGLTPVERVIHQR